MTVEQLIKLLAACDPKALVVINEEPMCEGDRDIMQWSMQLVASIQSGWADKHIECDMSFSLVPVGTFLVPAVRIMGVNHEPYTSKQTLEINGVGPMKDVRPATIKKIGSKNE